MPCHGTICHSRNYIPVDCGRTCNVIAPHKAVAEVSKNRKPIGEIGCCESGMAERIH